MLLLTTLSLSPLDRNGLLNPSFVATASFLGNFQPHPDGHVGRDNTVVLHGHQDPFGVLGGSLEDFAFGRNGHMSDSLTASGGSPVLPTVAGVDGGCSKVLSRVHLQKERIVMFVRKRYFRVDLGLFFQVKNGCCGVKLRNSLSGCIRAIFLLLLLLLR